MKTSNVEGGTTRKCGGPLFFVLLILTVASPRPVMALQTAGSSSGPPEAYFLELFAEGPLRLEMRRDGSEQGAGNRASYQIDATPFLRYAREGDSPVPWWRRLKPILGRGLSGSGPEPTAGVGIPQGGGRGDLSIACWYVLLVRLEGESPAEISLVVRATGSRAF